MTDEQRWKHRRALSGLIECARDACCAAQAIATQDGLADRLHDAKLALITALNYVDCEPVDKS